ncbi:hypothetical protein RV13_GL000174 [Enterococcus raffinosus]|nr:hypothetical protein RV13_GL000174 [Enterococcus raffinosus]OSH08251.1 hypothetical protein ELS84_2090 [Enterococcus faecalis]
MAYEVDRKMYLTELLASSPIVTLSNEKGVGRLEKLPAMKLVQNDRPSAYRWL